MLPNLVLSNGLPVEIGGGTGRVELVFREEDRGERGKLAGEREDSCRCVQSKANGIGDTGQ